MSVTYAASTGIFTIHTDNTTYQMKVDSLGYLLHLYYCSKKGKPHFLISVLWSILHRDVHFALGRISRIPNGVRCAHYIVFKNA